jgi:hypothetical protein
MPRSIDIVGRKFGQDKLTRFSTRGVGGVRCYP